MRAEKFAAAEQQQAIEAVKREREESALAETEKAEAEQRQMESEFKVLDLEACRSTGDDEKCQPLRVFMDKYAGEPYQRVRAAYEQGKADRKYREEEPQRRAEAETRDRLEQQWKRERAAAEAAERARKRKAQDAAGGDRRVCCCDGTVSPTCATVHRGCCSHHGGVCGCR